VYLIQKAFEGCVKGTLREWYQAPVGNDNKGEGVYWKGLQ